MAASDAALCSAALALLGESPITSLQDDTAAGRICNTWYATARDACLAAHRWNFAIKRATLNKLVATPAFGFNYYFQLPTDYLRMVETNPADTDYVIEGTRLLSNDSPIKIAYVYKVTDTSAFAPLFDLALIYKLAAVMAEGVAEKAALAARMDKVYLHTIETAKRADALDGSSIEITADDLITVRQRGQSQLVTSTT